jgi:Domain of unknown function (DUF4214)
MKFPKFAFPKFAFPKFALAAFTITLIPTTPSWAQEQRCQETSEYVLCFDEDWLHYYRQLDLEFDWRNYLQEDRLPQPSDYYNDVESLYREVLGREAQADELVALSRQLADGVPLSRIRSSLADSSEARTQIDRIYQEVLGRNVDPDGLKTWTQKLARGGTLAEVRQEIELSEEARIRQQR